MAADGHEMDFAGWVLIDLDDPVPRRALETARQMGIAVDEFIEMAVKEKLERMERHEE